MKQVSGMLLVLGAVQVVIGSVCIMAPVLAGEALVTLVGILLGAAGAVELFEASQSGGFGRGRQGYLGGVLAVLGGILIVIAPHVMLAFLTLLVAIYFLVDGVQRVSLAWSMKSAQGWGWLMFCGVIGLFLGASLLAQWPFQGQWVVGLMVGIGVLFRGWMVLMIALAARRAAA
jgi:uncharacterized membrane protein HdeD (DUF308 family)